MGSRGPVEAPSSAGRGRRARSLAAALVTLATAALAGSAPPAPRARHAVLVSIDSLRADHLSFHGYPRETMPRLAELLARRGGTIFRNATAVSPSCHPSHTAMLTGLYPQEVGVPWCGEDLIVKWSDLEEERGREALERYQESLRAEPEALRSKRLSAVRNGLTIPPGQERLPGLLAAAGFRTFGAVSIWTVAGRFGYAAGFERYADATPEYYGPRSLTWLLRDAMGSQRRQPAGATVDAALAQIASLAAGDRLFLFVNLADTHVPYASRGRARWSGGGGAGRAAAEAAWRRRYPSGLWERARAAMETKEGFLLDRYDDAIRATDAELGRLVDALATAGILADTLLVVTSDHGDSFGQHAYLSSTQSHRLFFEHSVYLWEETQHVPLVVSAPGGAPGARFRDVNVSQVDLEPTILAALGLAGAGSGGPGRDLASLPEEPRAVFFLTFGRGQPGLLSRTRLAYPKFIGVRRGAMKFFVDRERFRDARAGSCWLFDLAADPDELENLCERRPVEAARLRKVLVDWFDLSNAVRPPSPPARRR